MLAKISSAVAEESNINTSVDLPRSFSLEQNYPNPFNPQTEIRFQIPEASHVVVRIFNVIGEEIRTLVNSPYEAGYHGVRWNGKDNRGNDVASGVYLYQIHAGEFSQVLKMSLLR
ncbi:MAG: FlgD immunoglobulin-like domain containing protein [bacterium]